MLCSADRIDKETSLTHYKEPAIFALLEVVYKFRSVKYGLLAIYSTMGYKSFLLQLNENLTSVHWCILLWRSVD